MQKYSNITKLFYVRHIRTLYLESSSVQSRVKKLLEDNNVKDFNKPNSPQTKLLAIIVNEIDDGNEMKRIKNILIKKFKNRYAPLMEQLMHTSLNPSKLGMSLMRHTGSLQMKYYLKSLSDVLDNSDFTNQNKKERLYSLIKFQNALYPKVSKEKGFILPDHVHKWFWDKLKKDESANHYYFLIQNDIHLSSSEHIRLFFKRLLQGSQLDIQLATFKIFLNEESHHGIFFNKFCKLYDFDTMAIILNKQIQRKDFQFIKLYFTALLRGLDVNSKNVSALSTNTLYDSRILKFNDCLLYYLAKTGNIDMFMETFINNISQVKEIESRQIPSNSIIKDANSNEIFRNMQKPISNLLTLLREKGMHEEVFKVFALLQSFPISNAPSFRYHMTCQLIASLRTFNDATLSLQYILSAYRSVNTRELLNNLGLWSWILHGNGNIFSHQELQCEFLKMEKLLPPSATLDGSPSLPIITELYRGLLTINAKTMNSTQYRDLLLDLYDKYKQTMKIISTTDKYWKQNTSILNVFLYHIRYSLNDHILAFEILKDFFFNKFSKKVKSTASASPFSIVVYENYKLTHSDISTLLNMMDEIGISLDFKFCAGMVLRHIRSNNSKEAYTWYKKILNGKFEVRHIGLVKAIKNNNWEYPLNFDKTLLEKLETLERGKGNNSSYDNIIDDELDTFNEDPENDKDYSHDFVMSELKSLFENLKSSSPKEDC